MCGIATVSIGKRARKLIPYPKLRDLVRELLVELEPRGKDASGIAVINENGQKPTAVFKKPLRSSRLVERPKFDTILEHIDESTNFIMLHTRASTIGNNSYNFNNHPIMIPDFVGIHNGTLVNSDTLFKRHENDFNRIGSVDSEVIFQLYKHYTLTGLEAENAIKSTASELAGAFTGAVVDLHNPHRMTMFKQDRALCIVTIPFYDIIIAISEASFFKEASKRLNIKSKTGPCYYVHNGVGIVVDLNIKERITNKINDFQLPIKKTPQSHFNRKPWLRSIG